MEIIKKVTKALIQFRMRWNFDKLTWLHAVAPCGRQVSGPPGYVNCCLWSSAMQRECTCPLPIIVFSVKHVLRYVIARRQHCTEKFTTELTHKWQKRSTKAHRDGWTKKIKLA